MNQHTSILPILLMEADATSIERKHLSLRGRGEREWGRVGAADREGEKKTN